VSESEEKEAGVILQKIEECLMDNEKPRCNCIEILRAYKNGDPVECPVCGESGDHDDTCPFYK